MYKCIYQTNNISHIHVTCLEFSFFIHLLHFFKVLVSNAIYTEIVEQQEALILQGVSSGLHLEGDIVEMSLLFKNEAHIKFSLVHIFGEFCVHCLLFENNRCIYLFGCHIGVHVLHCECVLEKMCYIVIQVKSCDLHYTCFIDR